MQERTSLEDSLSGIGKVERDLQDNIDMISLGEEENDAGVVTEAENALKELKKEVARRELEALLSGEADKFDSYLEVHAGAGGTESQDWAQMLLRMYSALGRKARLQGRVSRGVAGRRGRHQIRHHPDLGSQRLWLAEDRKLACIAWCGYRRSIPMRGGTPRSRRCRSFP
jgi:protein subunit release factor A